MTDETVEYGPLGPGREPEKDPMKGIRGVMAGTLVLEAISIALVLTVILRVDDGAHWTTFNWVYVSVLAVVMFLAAFVQHFDWSVTLNVALQVFALAGFFIHVSMGVVAIIFIAVWAYLLYLRKNMIERKRRGLLVTQHM